MAMLGMGDAASDLKSFDAFWVGDFNCPTGSDYDKSQEVGMCVAADYSPVGIKSPAGGATTYYNLDGTVGGVDPGKPKAKPLIPGVPDMYLYIGGAALLAMVMLGGRRRR